MTLPEIENYITGLPNVTTTESFGYRFFCYSTDQVRPFISLIDADNEHDRRSNLDREGAFRLNIGISKETFKSLFPEKSGDWDYTKLNQFMPHPEYASHYFLCVLSPSGEVLKQTLQFIDEAYALAKKRFESRQNG